MDSVLLSYCKEQWTPQRGTSLHMVVNFPGISNTVRETKTTSMMQGLPTLVLCTLMQFYELCGEWDKSCSAKQKLLMHFTNSGASRAWNPFLQLTHVCGRDRFPSLLLLFPPVTSVSLDSHLGLSVTL